MTIADDDDDSTPPPSNGRRSVEHLRGLAEDPLADISAFMPSPAEYIRSFRRLRSEAQWEIVRSFLHPMLRQRIPQAEIARTFEVSIDTIGRWKARYHEDLRREAVTMQARDYIMESMESLREARAEAWKGYYLARTPKEKRGFLQTVTQIEAQFARQGESIGLYGGRGDKPMASATYGEKYRDPGVASAERIKTMLECFLDPRATTEDLDRMLSDRGLLPGSVSDGGADSYDDLFAGLEDECPDAEQVTPEEAPAPQINITVRRRSRPA